MGIRGSSTCELIFENCIVPKENLLGQEGKGFVVAMTTLDDGRIGIAAQALGLAEGALEETIKYVKERKQFGRPLAKFQNTQFEIADMETKIKAAQLLMYRAAIAEDTQKSLFGRSSNGKTVLRIHGNGCYHTVPTASRRIRLIPVSIRLSA